MTTSATWLYLYGLVPADAPPAPPTLRGVDDAPVERLALADVGALVSRVPAAAYAQEVLDAHLADPAWLGPRAQAHEGVLLWYLDRGPVLPLAPFSLHRDEAALEARLAPVAEALRAELDRLRDRAQWGVRLWLVDVDAAAQAAAAASVELRALEAERAAAPPGRRYLLDKKADQLRREALRQWRLARAQELASALAPLADEMERRPLPGGEAARTLLLDLALLVADAARDALQRALGAFAAAHAPALRIELTGPWPAYRFVRLPWSANPSSPTEG